MYELLHEADGVEEEIANKYNVPTYDEYYAWCQDNIRPLVHNYLYNNGPKPTAMSVKQNWSCIQKLAFTIISAINSGGQPPRAMIINRKFATRLLEEEGEIPKTIENVPLAFKEKGLFEVTYLA